MIGTAAAILGAAVIGGGISAASNASATKTATNAAAQTTAANNALAREFYAKNEGNLSPYIQSGYAPTSALMSRLGLTGTPQVTSNVLNATQGKDGAWSVAPQSGQADYAAYVAANPDIAAEAQRVLASNPKDIGDLNHDGKIDATDYGQLHAQQFHDRAVPTFATDPNAAQPLSAQQQLAQDIGTRPTFSRPDAGPEPGLPSTDFTTYQQSPYVDFLIKSGQRNLNAGAAAGGLLNSGAAVQNALQLGQDISGKGYQDWFSNQLGLYDRRVGQFNLDRNVLNDNYNGDRAFGASNFEADRGYQTGRYDTQTNDLFRLSNQGLTAANALAGVGQNYVGQVSSNNNNQASITGNAALAGAANTSGVVNNALNAYGYYLGSKGSGGFAGTSPMQFPDSTKPLSYTGALNPYRT